MIEEAQAVERDALPALDVQPASDQFVNEYSLVHRLDQPRPDPRMDHRRVHDLSTDQIQPESH